MKMRQMLLESAERAFKQQEWWGFQDVIPYQPDFEYVSITYGCMENDAEMWPDTDTYFLLLCAEAERGKRK